MEGVRRRRRGTFPWTLEETQRPRSIACDDGKPDRKWLMPDVLWKEIEPLLPAAAF